MKTRVDTMLLQIYELFGSFGCHENDMKGL
jgi:hypothetical protein